MGYGFLYVAGPWRAFFGGIHASEGANNRCTGVFAADSGYKRFIGIDDLRFIGGGGAETGFELCEIMLLYEPGVILEEVYHYDLWREL